MHIYTTVLKNISKDTPVETEILNYIESLNTSKLGIMTDNEWLARAKIRFAITLEEKITELQKLLTTTLLRI